MSGQVQHDTYKRAPRIDWKLIFPNLTFISLVCSSFEGQSFLDGANVNGKGESLNLKGCLKSFSNLAVIFLTYWSWSRVMYFDS